MSDTHETQAATGEPIEDRKFEFHGDGFEYFKIWIVNILLTILTLGIYSAWAKVRNRRYFYSNLELDGQHFEYLADPITILKSRIIAVLALMIYLVGSNFYPIAGLVMVALLLIAMPWLLIRSLSFNHRVSAYRNVQFRFHGKYVEAFLVLYVWPIVGVLTLGILYPYALLKMNRFIVNNTAYGTSRFEFSATYKDYGLVFLGIIGIFILAGFISGTLTAIFAAAGQEQETAAAIGTIPIIIAYFLVIVYVNVRITNIYYNATQLLDHQFHAELEIAGYSKVMLINLLLIVVTFGLYLPAAKVRTTRYITENIVFVASGSLDDFSAAERDNVSALGEEFGDVFDFDVGII